MFKVSNLFKLIVEVAIDPYCLLAGIPQYSETVGQEESPSAYREGVFLFKAIEAYLLSSGPAVVF